MNLEATKERGVTDMRRARTVMIQGTGSHVGKSVITAALCRWFVQRGRRVAPFKAQNMSNNSCVTPDGKEIGQAQGLQADACRVPARTDFNPVLIKPSGPRQAQLVVNGVVAGAITPSEWGRLRREHFQTVCHAFARLATEFDLVVLEGAGSPAEINLRDHDIVNMRMAQAARAPVLLVGDIERGGVFASLVGTHALLEPEERRHVRGFIINKFCGERSLLDSGIAGIERRLGVRCLGVIPMWDQISLPEEDSVGWRSIFRRSASPLAEVTIGVANLPYLSNSTDVEALARTPGVRMVCIDGPTNERLDLLVFPGTKNTAHALKFVRAQGLDHVARQVWKTGGTVLGICGGFQLLGRRMLDPEAVESSECEMKGLGLLDIITVFARHKTTVQVAGRHLDSGSPVSGFEIHMGQAQAGLNAKPFLELHTNDHQTTRWEGAVSPDGRVIGTSVHGLFDGPEFTRAFLSRVRVPGNALSLPREGECQGSRDERLDRWTEVVARHLDMPAVEAIIEQGLS